MNKEDKIYYSQLALDYGNGAKLQGYSAAAHVEAAADAIFWNKIFKHFLPQYSFDFIAYSKTPEGKEATGCSVCLKYFELGCLSKDFFVCIDSDYRRLLREADLDVEHFVFQTYTYSIENHYCYYQNIENTLHKLGYRNDLFDFRSFLQGYSNILYELFIYHLVSLQKRDDKLTKYDFKQFIGLQNSSLNEKKIFADMRNRIESKLCELQPYYSASEIENRKKDCSLLGLTQDNAYLYFRGHNLFDQVALKLCGEIRKQAERNITQTYTSEEKIRHFSKAGKTMAGYLSENICFDEYAEINKIKADTEKYGTK